MGPAIAAYRRALAVTARTPAFTLGVPGVYLLGWVVSLVLGLLPFVGAVAGFVFVAPATAAVALGMADGALTGDDPLETGVERLEDTYVSMMGAYVALGVANTLVWIAVFALLLLGTLVYGDANTSIAASAVFVAVAAAVLGAMAWGALVLQFVGVAIVVGDDTATSTFGTATALFRTDRRGVVAYSALRVLTGAAALAVALGLFSVGYYGPGLLGAPWTGADPLLLGLGLAFLGALVVWPVTAAFLTAYHVAYFRARSAAAVARSADAITRSKDGADRRRGSDTDVGTGGSPPSTTNASSVDSDR